MERREQFADTYIAPRSLAFNPRNATELREKLDRKARFIP